MISLTQKIGFNAEKAALRYLKKQGLSLITKNFHYTQHGEIDLIMSDQDILVFIEVRYRKQINFGHPLETISSFKQQRLLKTALYYLEKQQLYESIPYRFDVIGITQNRQITWIKNAIEVEY